MTTTSTAILNCYRRPQNIPAQIDALMNQSCPPKEIWLWKNHYPDVQLPDLPGNVKVFDNNHNWKYCGRFAAACLVDTEFTVVLDDDTIPGPDWIKECYRTFELVGGSAILGGVGVRLLSYYSYQPNKRYGWVNPSHDIEEVDLVGHAWFFPADYIKFMWAQKPMWANGEDMHFSAMAQIYGGIKTYTTAHPTDETNVWSSTKGLELGVDEVASSNPNRHNKFYAERDRCIQRLAELGWQLHKDREE